VFSDLHIKKFFNKKMPIQKAAFDISKSDLKTKVVAFGLDDSRAVKMPFPDNLCALLVRGGHCDFRKPKRVQPKASQQARAGDIKALVFGLTGISSRPPFLLSATDQQAKDVRQVRPSFPALRCRRL
jgi:hypothetical protein